MIKNSSKLCPRNHGGEQIHLRWSENEHPPQVHFDQSTGRIQSVSLMRFCISCGYKEIGFLAINQMPTFTEQKEEQ
jgi:hypothetical protein